MLRFAETQTPALNDANGHVDLLRQPFLVRGIRVQDVRRHPGQRLRVDLGREQHVLRVLRSRQTRTGGGGLVRGQERALDPVDDEAIVIRELAHAIVSVGVGELLQRRQVRHPRHGDEIAGRRVVAERQERQRTRRTLAGGDEGGERRIRQAVEFSGGHVALAGGVIVDRIVEAVEREQGAAEFFVERLVAETADLVPLRRGVLVVAAGEDVAFLIESIDAADPLRVHQQRRVPAAGRVEDEVVRPLVRGVPLLGGLGAGITERSREAEASESAELEKIATIAVHGGYS